jgi:hypothetical protein
MSIKTIAYWTATVLLAFALLSGAYGELTRQFGTMETVTILGYPEYFLTIIGLWKIAGAIALLVPSIPRIKEWAYAGVFFNMTGAFISHAAVNDQTFHLFATGSIIVLIGASYLLRPQSRKLAEVRQHLVDEQADVIGARKLREDHLKKVEPQVT